MLETYGIIRGAETHHGRVDLTPLTPCHTIRMPALSARDESQQPSRQTVAGFCVSSEVDMPIIGEIQRGQGLGFNNNRLHQYCRCPDCGKERWVVMRNKKPQSERCHPCGAVVAGITKRGTPHPHRGNWRGGRQVSVNGYIVVTVSPDDPYRAMAGKEGHVYEHRIVMARHLGRCLETWEEVHHKDHNKHNNQIENLEMMDKRTHAFNHASVSHLLARIVELEEVVKKYRDKYGNLD